MLRRLRVHWNARSLWQLVFQKGAKTKNIYLSSVKKMKKMAFQRVAADNQSVAYTLCQGFLCHLAYLPKWYLLWKVTEPHQVELSWSETVSKLWNGKAPLAYLIIWPASDLLHFGPSVYSLCYEQWFIWRLYTTISISIIYLYQYQSFCFVFNFMGDLNQKLHFH